MKLKNPSKPLAEFHAPSLESARDRLLDFAKEADAPVPTLAAFVNATDPANVHALLATREHFLRVGKRTGGFRAFERDLAHDDPADVLRVIVLLPGGGQSFLIPLEG